MFLFSRPSLRRTAFQRASFPLCAVILSFSPGISPFTIPSNVFSFVSKYTRVPEKDDSEEDDSEEDDSAEESPHPERIYHPLRRFLTSRLTLLQYREEGARQTIAQLRQMRESMRGMSLVERERVISRLKNPAAFRR